MHEKVEGDLRTHTRRKIAIKIEEMRCDNVTSHFYLFPRL